MKSILIAAVVWLLYSVTLGCVVYAITGTEFVYGLMFFLVGMGGTMVGLATYVTMEVNNETM